MSDLISRQAAIDAVTITPQKWDGMYIQDLNCRLRDTLNALPSAQPEIEPKTGRWIDDCGGVKCSCCGYYIDDNYYAKNYCTNCGAKMEGEADEQ